MTFPDVDTEEEDDVHQNEIDWMESSQNPDYHGHISNLISLNNANEIDDSLKLELCPNFSVCNQFLKVVQLEGFDGRCLDCDIVFGRNLEFETVLRECPICLGDNIDNVKMPNCCHSLCKNCFQELFRRGASDDTTSQQQNLVNCPLCGQRTIPSWSRPDEQLI